MGKRRRRPLVAGLLSILIVGLGDAYNGFPRKGIRLLAVAIGLGLGMGALLLTFAQPGRFWFVGPFVAYWVVPFAIRAFAGARAWGDARRLRDTSLPGGTLRRSMLFAAGAVGASLVAALVVRTFVVQAFKIPSGAMLPTLQIGDHILVDKFIYGPRLEIPYTQLSLGQLPGVRKPLPGDVVVFIWPKDRSKDFIKRVIAVEGQAIEVRNKQSTWTVGRGTIGTPCGAPDLAPRPTTMVRSRCRPATSS